MTYREIYKKAVGIIGFENIEDYRPAFIESKLNGMYDFLQLRQIPNTICIWLKNGDCIYYINKSKEERI